MDSTVDSPVVKLTKLDDSIIRLRMDPKSMKMAEQIMDKLVKYHISSIIGLHMPDFHKDFPDKIPPKLWFPGKGLKKSGEKKTIVKKETSTLEEEAKKFVKEEPSLIPLRKRRTRFSGSYNAEVIQKPASVVGQLKKKVRTTSDASSSSFTSQTVKPIRINCGKGKDPFILREDFSSSSSSGDSSDSEHESEAQGQMPNKRVKNARDSFQNLMAPQQTSTETPKQQEFPSYRAADPLPTAVSTSQILSDSFPADLQSPVRAVNPFRAPRRALQLSDSSSDEEVEAQRKRTNLNVQQVSVQKLTYEQENVEIKKSPAIDENKLVKKNGIVIPQDKYPPATEITPEVQTAISKEPEKVMQSFAEKPTDVPIKARKEKETSLDSVTVMKVQVNKTAPKPVAELKKLENKSTVNKAAEVQVDKTAQKPETEFKKPEKEKKLPVSEAGKVKVEKIARKSANRKDALTNEAKKSESNKDSKIPIDKKTYEKPKVIDPPMVRK